MASAYSSRVASASSHGRSTTITAWPADTNGSISGSIVAGVSQAPGTMTNVDTGSPLRLGRRHHRHGRPRRHGPRRVRRLDRHERQGLRQASRSSPGAPSSRPPWRPSPSRPTRPAPSARTPSSSRATTPPRATVTLKVKIGPGGRPARASLRPLRASARSLSPTSSWPTTPPPSSRPRSPTSAGCSPSNVQLVPDHGPARGPRGPLRPQPHHGPPGRDTTGRRGVEFIDASQIVISSTRPSSPKPNTIRFD